MFILTKISDLVQITPEDLKKPGREAIEDNINAKYANKVIQKIGLCICLYDLLSSSSGQIGHGTGLVNVNVEFRLIVFRPFKHEVLLGRISSSHPTSLKIRTDFFDDIVVPGYLLPEGSYFDHNEQLWIWDNNGDKFYYDHQETVRFRIESEDWVDQTPVGPSSQNSLISQNSLMSGTNTTAGSFGLHGLSAAPGNDDLTLNTDRKDGAGASPYQITASMLEEGLGPVLWWDVVDEELDML